MDVLKKKRKAVRSQATRLTKETDDILAAEEALTNEKVSVLLERLRLVKQQLNDVDAAIEPNVKDDEAEAEFEQVIEYGDKIATCICRLNLKKEQTEQASKDKEIRFQATVGSASAAQRIKLPKQELTKFDGKRKNWQPFWEQFEVAVQKSTELSNIDRLNYLKTLLTGEAVTAIAGLQASGDCYSDAVDILRQRFGNPEALVQDHMQGLIDVKPVFSARNVRALRGLYGEIHVHMRGLKALGIEDDGYQAMLYPVLGALPKELILDYHRSHAENQEEATPAVVDDSGSTTSSSDSSQLTPLHSLLRFFRFELESRERTLEDRPDDAHGKPASHFDGHKARKHRGHARPSSASALHDAAICMQCVFCDSKTHETQECESKMTVNENPILTPGRRNENSPAMQCKAPRPCPGY
ncbi:hypothetical protein V5799_024231 [Amblyomma americanum]|uniref:Uncharacterized protein n=1 Tax=Amblyomma americanum TaxID=6943 RepID=A0AAQ4ED60_AMBAM